MERTQQLFEKIEGYLAKTLSSEEVIVFQKELAINQELQLEVEKHRELHHALSDTDTLAFTEKLLRIREEIKIDEVKNKAVSVFKLPSYWKIAASLVFIIGLGTVLWQVSQKNSAHDLYMAYYIPYPADDVTRGATEKKPNEFLKNYRQKKYKEVSIELEKLMVVSKNEKLRLYLGNSYLNIGREQDALLEFKKVSDTSRYYQHANWFRALTYLKLEDAQLSISILQDIMKHNGIYKHKAAKLVEKLTK